MSKNKNKLIITSVEYSTSHKSNINKDNTHIEPNNKCNCLNYNVNDKGEFIYDENIEFNRCNHDSNKNGYCSKHQHCKEFMKLFTNKEEPEYEPVKWNDNLFVKGSHNCYSYFLNQIPSNALTVKCKELCNHKNNNECIRNSCRGLIPQPGDTKLVETKKLGQKDYQYTCPKMIKRITSDNPDIKKTKLTQKCPLGTYKGAMVVHPLKTFHFYRLNKDGSWSHKPGTTSITKKDASNKEILIPHFADRDYIRNGSSDIKYDDFCGYFCIPKFKNKYMA